MNKIFKKLLILVAFMLFVPSIFALELTEDLTLEDDSTECYVVKRESDITLNLNGHNITCADMDAIYVENGAKLTIEGEGVISSTKSNYAALFNNGSVILNGGTLKADDSVTHYYAILNHGVMTINEEATVLQVNYDNSASLIDNGYCDYESRNERKGYVVNTGMAEPTLIINGGLFDGGRNTIKNDDAGILTIHDGHYVNNVQVAVMNWNVATITGGTFEVPTGNDKTTLFDGSYANNIDKGILNIIGGTFNGEYIIEFMTGKVKAAKVTIKDGIFNSSVAFVNPKESESVTRPSWSDVGTTSITGGVFTDVNIEPDYKYGLTSIDKDYNEDGVNDLLVIPPVSIELPIGKTYDTALSTGFMEDGTWTSSNSGIATVSKGIITAHTPGTALITVRYGNDKKTYDVEVVKNGISKPTLSKTKYTYTGKSIVPEVTGYIEELMNVEGDVEASLVGQNEIVYSLKDTDNYTWDDGSTNDVVLNWEIEKAKIEKPELSNTSFGYTGKDITPEFIGYNPDLMDMSGDTNAKLIGEYEIVIGLVDTDNYEWADGKVDDVQYSWEITKAKVSIPELSLTSYSYTGEEITPEFMGYDPDLMIMSGDTNGLITGDYEIVIGLKDVNNYEWADGKVADIEYGWTIVKAKLPKPTLTKVNYAYTGKAISPEVNGYDSSLIVVEGDVEKTAVGEYEIIFSLKDNKNYEWENGRISDVALDWNIIKAVIAKPTLTTTSFTYSGSEITPEVSGFDAEIMNASGEEKATVVGSYSIVYELKDVDNYEWVDGGVNNVTLNWSIKKASLVKPTLTTTSYAYSGNEITPEVNGYDSLTMSVSGEEKATLVGTYTMVYELKDVNNYEWSDGGVASVSLNWSINKVKVIKPSIEEAIFTYDGEEHILELNDYDNTLVTMTGKTSATNAGDYQLVFALKDTDNYEWNDGKVTDVTLGWQILKAKLAKPTLKTKNYAYTGEEISPEINGLDENLMKLGGITLGSPVGKYVAKVSLIDKDNYEWADGSVNDVELEWVITFKTPELTATSTYNSVKLKWSNVDGSTGYQVYKCNSEGASCKKLTTTTKLSYTDKDLTFNKKYYYKVRSYKKEDGSTIYGKFSDLVAIKTALGKAKITVSTDRYRNILIEWKNVSGAQRYYVYRCNEDGKDCEYMGFAYDNDFINTTAKEGVTYVYKVRTYRSGVYGKYSDGVVGLRLDDTIKYTVKNTAYKVNTIKINNVETATKYYIYRSTSKNGTYTKIKTVKATGNNIVFKDKDVSFNSTYYYKVKINNDVNDSDFSAIKSVTTNKLAVPKFEVSTSGSYVTIDINSVSGATGYQILYSTDGEEYSTLVKTKNTSYDKKLSDDSYYIKIRAYRKEGSNYYYSNYSKVYEFDILGEK